LTKLREQLRQSELKFSEQEEKFNLYLEIKLAEKEEELNDESFQLLPCTTTLSQPKHMSLQRSTLVSSLMSVPSNIPANSFDQIRLAVLKRQYLPYDTAVWDTFVADLMKKYNQLDIEPLAHLCLTTSNPQATMTQVVPGALSHRASCNAGKSRSSISGS